MRDTDHSSPLSTYLSACCFHTSIVATENTETHWSSKKLKKRDSLVAKKVENVSFETQNPRKKVEKYLKKKQKNKKNSTVKVDVSPLSYHCHLLPLLSTNNLTAFIRK